MMIKKRRFKIYKKINKSDKRISLIINKKTLGAGLSRNYGIKNLKVNILVLLMLMIYGKKIN